MKTECYGCGGTGQMGEWTVKKKIFVYIVSDCRACNGKGFIEFVMVDKRLNSKKRKRIFPEHG